VGPEQLANRYWLKRTFRLMLGLIRCINARRDVSEELPLKRDALSAHASQFAGEASLARVSDGEWLPNFFMTSEFYFRYRANEDV
jgi:LmbE family N-acetylglucosaminyl deacetylase